jgi:hypothetical protein
MADVLSLVARPVLTERQDWNSLGRKGTRLKPLARPKLGPFIAVIDKILADDTVDRRSSSIRRSGFLSDCATSTASRAHHDREGLRGRLAATIAGDVRWCIRLAMPRLARRSASSGASSARLAFSHSICRTRTSGTDIYDYIDRDPAPTKRRTDMAAVPVGILPAA